MQNFSAQHATASKMVKENRVSNVSNVLQEQKTSSMQKMKEARKTCFQHYQTGTEVKTTSTSETHKQNTKNKPEYTKTTMLNVK